ncbi:MAG: DUF4234 domain-containing protein [Oscillospiraceae bacterium]|nr:DUF4234 domain-containing protein [Oscillospiraceae bacterium]
MAFCGNCGVETADDGVCPNCGPAVAQAADVAPPEREVPQQQYQQPPQQEQYQQPPPQPYGAPGGRPAIQLNTTRGLLKYILLSIVTFGIYSIVFYYGISSDINTTASRYDGKKTMNYALLLFLIAPLTLGIAAFVWNHNLYNRIGEELKRRGLNFQLSAGDFWLWGVIGSLIIVGPFIALHKLATASNMVNESYNNYG